MEFADGVVHVAYVIFSTISVSWVSESSIRYIHIAYRAPTVSRRARDQRFTIRSSLPTNVPINTFNCVAWSTRSQSSFCFYQVSRLAAIGGSSVKEVTRRILRYIMTDSCAKHFNWKGKGQKSAFSQLHLNTVIIRECMFAVLSYQSNMMSLKYVVSRQQRESLNTQHLLIPCERHLFDAQ